MTRLLSLSSIGVLAVLWALATPATSQAQFGIRLQVGNSSFSYRQGGFNYYNNGYYGGYGGYSGYNSGYIAPYQSYYGGYGYSPTIVHPEVYHYTPRRGLHTHGHIHVPSYYGYSTYRY